MDSIVCEQVYGKLLDEPNAYANQLQSIAHQIPNKIINIESYFWQENNLYIGIKLYFELNSKALGVAYGIIKLENNKIADIHFNKTRQQIEEEAEQQKNTNSFTLLSMNVYEKGLILPYQNENITQDRRFLCYWTPQQIEVLPQELPKIYGKGHMHVPKVSGTKYMLSLESKIFDITNDSIIDLQLFQNPDIICDAKNPNSFRSIQYAIFDFQMDDKFYYVIYQQRGTKGQSFLSKVDKKSLHTAHFIIPSKASYPTIMNPYNFSSVLIPNDENLDVVKY